MAIATDSGVPVAAHIEKVKPHELKLVVSTIGKGFTREAPEKIIDDKAYASDPLAHRLLDERGIEMIAPPRNGPKKPITQCGSKLGRYCHRCKVEQFFAWLQNFKRIVVRYEDHSENFLGMLRFDFAIILLRLI